MRRFLPTLALAAVLAPAARPAPSPPRPVLPDKAARSELREVAVTTSFGTKFVHLRQVVNGVPVLGAGAVVTDLPGAKRDLLIDHSRTGLRAPGAPTVSRQEAIDTAVRAVGAAAFRADPSASLAILPRPPGGVLVWRALLPAASPLGSFEVLVDAQSTRVLRVRDLLRRATGQAAIFDPNPVEANNGTSGLADANDADSPLLTSRRTSVTLERLNAGNCLDGQWVKAVLPSGAVCLAGRDFRSVTRANDQFEALMAYFHIDRTQEYIRSLGFTTVANRQLQVNADDSSPFPPGEDDNSFYDPTTGQITLGPGGVDDGEDADIIVHEYGHAVQDSQVPGFGDGDDAGAMGEGFADYLAATISATYTPSATWDICIAEWDVIGEPGGCLRRVNSTETLAQLKAQCSGDIHCVGMAWSSVLWAISGALGAPAAMKLVLQSHFSLPTNASFEDGSRALLAADRTLYGGANQGLLRDALTSRGLLDLAHLDDEPDGATPLGVPGAASESLDAGSDAHDVYSLALTPGRGLTVNLSGAGDFDLRLFAPGTTSVFSGTLLAGATTAGTSTESFTYVPAGAGTYFLDVSATSGAGSYTVQTISDADGDGAPDGSDNCPAASNRDQRDSDGDRIGDACDRFPRDAANDADRDGVGADTDNCPAVANANQRNWDGDRRGDVCDRSSKISVRSVSVRGRRVTVVGSVRPVTVDRAGWTVFVQRRVCQQTCRYAPARSVAGTRKSAAGRIELRFNLGRAGRYRLYALVTDRRYQRARSGVVALQIAARKRA